MVRHAIAGHGAAGVALGGGEAAARGLHIGDQIDEVFDGLLVLLQAHRIGQREGQAEGEFGLGEPAVEVVPQQPSGDRLGRGLDQEHPLPRDEHIVEPHLAVELVEPA